MESQVGIRPALHPVPANRAHSVPVGAHHHALNHVSIQADLCVPDPTSYESEDEIMGRRKQLASRGQSKGGQRGGTPLYSKEDIREQYCINEKQLHGLDDVHDTGGLFGCLSNYHVSIHYRKDSSCSSRSPSLLTVCVRQKVPSDENLHDLYRRPMHEYAPLPRWPRYFPQDDSMYFRRRPKSLCNDPYNYNWFPEDEENMRMMPHLQEHARPLQHDGFDMMCNSYPRRGPHLMSYSTEYLVGRHDPCPAHPYLPPPPPPPALPVTPHRQKHVSFARSHTLTSFDDAAISIGRSSAAASQERLIDGKKSTETREQPPKVVVMEKVKRAPMKTQATQTEVCLGRKPLPPSYLSLSPRTVQRVRMVSQGAQTNGEKNNSRKLMKSFSEVGGQFGSTATNNADPHEPLQRTQSEEPPRSPFIAVSPQEILIDFEPLERRGRKRVLAKTVSDGEILEGRASPVEGEGTQSDCEQCHHHLPIDEPLEKRSATVYVEQHHSVKSPVKTLITADSQEEEFHENLVYGPGLFRKRSVSLEETEDAVGSTAGTELKVTPSTTAQSLFASSDSLNTRDHSDSIWNESQATVLHADSDNNGGGTGVSCSDLSSSLAPSAAVMSMTPTTRRKHLLMQQHNQRSSMDTEALDTEDLESEQPPISPRIRVEAPSIVPTVAVSTPTIERPADCTKHKSALNLSESQRKDHSLSPSHRGRRKSPGSRTPESESQLVPLLDRSGSNELLVRTDSGRTNITDMSETSTTTEDYATATENNSGTDTSSRQLPRVDSGPQASAPTTAQPSTGGSSFESGSSLYSFARADATEDIQQVPCSPPPIEEEKERVPEEVEEKKHKDGDSVSGESSSCGSYSVDGSSGEKQGGASEHSGRCSTPGDYESPTEDQQTSSKNRKWSDEEIVKAKKGFKLELSPHREAAAPMPTVTSPQARSTWPRKSPTAKDEEAVTPRRSKPRCKSPVQPQGKRTPSNQIVHVSNGVDEGSSEESNDECVCGKSRRPRESPRRKTGGGRSPTSHARTSAAATSRRRSNSGEENCRRRYSVAAKSPSPVSHSHAEEASCHSGHVCFHGDVVKSPDHSTLHVCVHDRTKSPGGSPGHHIGKSKGAVSPESARLKALSAESLRSVSPGSDSVFYSEHSSNTYTLTEQHSHSHSHSLCHHCGRHVECTASQPTTAQTTAVVERTATGDIVQPPAGFADSPRAPHRAARIYKKADKRFRSEERRHHARMHAEAVRAKSEERGKDEQKEKPSTRPITRSTDASMEKLRCSPSSLGSDEDDCTGFYTKPFHCGIWVYIGSTEELHAWQLFDDKDPNKGEDRRPSVESTHSEQEFRRRYQAITHRMVHRKSSLEMYRRIASKSFADSVAPLRCQLQEVLRQMCMLWCRQNSLDSVINKKFPESDKRIMVRRVSGEFGFRIHGSRPVVVSAIEPATPAESSGLEVGDIVISVNNINVLEASHSEVVKLAHAGSDTLELEVARTCNVFEPEPVLQKPAKSGFLLKLSAGCKMRAVWVPRYFVLKHDNCVYYYKTEKESQPLGALHLADYIVTLTPDSGQPYSFRLSKKGSSALHLAADSAKEAEDWVALLGDAAAQKNEEIVDEEYLKSPATKIPQPDCVGTLCTLTHHHGKTWKRRFCVLKDACLYFYSDINADAPLGMTCIHGYKVQSSASGAKRFAFELNPPEPFLRHFYFYAETEMDKKRWLAALEYSIDRWIKVG
ncbi:uncharacterized protein LOC111051707 isoform X2 [Nilaparvata lugens]|uniref:uncharacterized protein LOC111051707 isoform X2 n=1 Tax=Nilaparvata lugens TaxID=108931 RepID=UPI00193D5FD7|nr:uncharacterized protein LOC111051707 isoform X2 [Nilaparvata lugens]